MQLRAFVRKSAAASAWLVAALAAATVGAAPVSWTGLGDGVNWSDPLNWSGNALPGPADDVTINIAANPTIIVSGVNPVIQSLSTAEELRISAGATFTTATAACTAPVRLGGGTIAGGAWTFTNGAALLIVGTAEGRLNNPAISGDVIHVDVSSRLRVNVNTTFTAMRFRGNNQSAAFEAGYVLNSLIIADPVSSASAWVETLGNGSFTVGSTGVIATLPGVQSTIAVGQPYWYSSTTALTVQGLISNRGPGSMTVDPSTLSVAASGTIENIGTGSSTVGVRTAPLTWTNSGTISVTAGRMTLTDTFTNSGTLQITGAGRLVLDGAWTNSGTIALSGSGRLDLHGSFTTAAIGTITRGGGGTDGTVAVMGAWNNTGATYTFGTAGSFLLDGGTITGGTISPGLGGQTLIPGNSTNTLNGVNYTGELVLDTSSGRLRVDSSTTLGGVRVRAGNGGVSFAPGYVINFPIIIESNASIGTVGFDTNGNGTLTFGSSASISSIGTWTGTLSFGPSWWSSASAEFIVQGTMAVGGTGRTLRVGGTVATIRSGGAVNVSGGTTLVMDVSGGQGSSWSCAGSISVADGVFQASDTWSITGSVLATNATITLDGVYSTSSVSRINRTGGVLNLQGQCDNTGRTTVLGPTTGSWRVISATITGGTIDGTPTDRLVITSSGGTLIDVTLADELVLDDGSSARVRLLGTTTMPSARLVSLSAGLSYGSGAVINYPIVSASPTATTHGIDSATAGATLTIGPSGSFTTAPGTLGSLSVGAVWWSNETATLNNQGLIAGSGLNRPLTIQATTAFNNTGTIRVRNGVDATIRALTGNAAGFDILDAGSTIEINGNYNLTGTLTVNPGTLARLRGTWTNTGTINVAASGVLELDGTFTLASLGTFTNAGGSVAIIGTLNNTSNLTLNAATGSWTLGSGARIIGGTVSQTQGSRLLFAGESTIENVQFTSELSIGGSNARVRLEGTSRAASYRLSGTSPGLLFPPGHVMNETIIGEGPNTKGVELWANGTLTIGPSGRISNTGGGISVGSFWSSGNSRVLVNQGVIESAGSSTLSINSPILGNYDAATGTLTGGVWRATQGANLNFGSNTILRNNARIELGGVGGTPNDLSSLSENLGTLELQDGRDITILGSQQQPTLFTNSGTIRLGAGSRLSIGSSSRGAAFTQTGTGTVNFDLGGENVNTEYGSMRVFGTATLDGTVQAQYVNNFQRQCGQLFQVIDANNRVGQFATRNVPPITDDSVFLVFYGGADVRMTVSARSDFNQDGFIDFFDYDEFVRCFEGDCPPGLSADFNLDDFVDFFDYSDFVFRFEAGCD
jgi:hypothetical protein